MLTLPNGVSASDTTYSDTENGDTTSENTKTVTRQYYYNSQPVGTAQVTVTSTPTPTASVTDTPSEDASDETGSFFSNPLILAFIIVDLIGVILIIVFAVKKDADAAADAKTEDVGDKDILFCCNGAEKTYEMKKNPPRILRQTFA
ncbi:MAG: hypothetical protein ACLRPV_13830 [Lacrimispora saccharolytica]